jgi:hypothetical protein
LAWTLQPLAGLADGCPPFFRDGRFEGPLTPALAKRSCVGAGALGGRALGQIFHHADPLQLVTPGRNPSVRRQPIPAGFHPDTSAAAFQPKSTFAFHPPVEALPAPRCFPLPHFIRLHGVPAIFQLRLIG